MDKDLRILVRNENVPPVIELDGELDAYTCGQLRDAMTAVIQDDSPTVIITMLKVQYMDSSGLGTLVAGLKRASERDGRVAVVCTNPQIRKVFEITGLVRVFPLYDSVEEAVRDIGR